MHDNSKINPFLFLSALARIEGRRLGEDVKITAMINPETGEDELPKFKQLAEEGRRNREGRTA